MRYKITAPETLDTTVKLPASKSISNRALVIHALSGGNQMPDNLSDCDDTEVIVRALRDMPYTIDIKAAGTAMRFMTAYLAVTDSGEHIITGTERQGMELRLTGSVISRPYIDLTLCTMRDFGAEVEWTGPDTIRVCARHYCPTPYFIENDWSAASYWYEIVALSGGHYHVQLEGLTDGSRQGDSVVRYLMSLLGVRTKFGVLDKGVPTTVTLSSHPIRLPRMEYNLINQPDLAQTMVVTCALMDIPFHFHGLSTLRIKETDRIVALIRELGKLGYVVKSNADNDLIWDGTRCEVTAPPVIDTYDDHRMALAFAPAALRFPEIRINNPSVVTKSYPHYWDHLRAAGFVIEEEA